MNAHQAGRGHVLGHGADGFTQTRAPYQVIEAKKHQRGHGHHDDGFYLDGHLQGQGKGVLQARVTGIVQIKFAVPQAFHQAHEILQEERHPDGGDERDQPVDVAAASQRPIGQPLDGHGHPAGDGGRHEHGQQGQQIGIAHMRAEVAVDFDPGDGADHKHFGMSEIDQAQHAVHHGVAQGDHGVDTAQQQAFQQHARQKLDQFVRQVLGSP
jgi:hypothetical protein